MQVEKNKVVEIDYTLKDDKGQVLDSSEGGQPLAYIQGVGNLIPGVENALEGKSSGERVQITVPPETGYGVRDDSLVLSIQRDKFSEVEDLTEGQRAYVPSRQTRLLKNLPLAGRLRCPQFAGFDMTADGRPHPGKQSRLRRPTHQE